MLFIASAFIQSAYYGANFVAQDLEKRDHPELNTKDINSRAVSWLALVQTVESIINFLFQPIWGKLTDKYLHHKTLCCIWIGVSAFCLIPYLSMTRSMIWVMFTLSGIFNVQLTNCISLVSDMVESEGIGLFLGFVALTYGIAQFCGPQIFDLIQSEESLSLAFLISCFGCALCAVLVLFIPKSDNYINKHRNKSTHISSDNDGDQVDAPWWSQFNIIASFKILCSNHGNSCVALVTFCYSYVTSSIAIVVFYYASDSGFDDSSISWLYSVFAIATLMAQLAMTTILEKLGFAKLLCVFMLMQSIFAFLCIIVTHANILSIALLMIFISGLGFCAGILYVACYTFISQVFSLKQYRSKQAEGLSAFSSVMVLANIAGQQVSSNMYSLNRFLPFIICSIVALVGFVVALVYKQKFFEVDYQLLQSINVEENDCEGQK